MGHVQDRWYRPARDDQGKIVVNDKGKPVLEKTELFGNGLRYKVRYLDPDGNERSTSFPDKQKKRADDFLIEVESDKREGRYIDPNAATKKFRQQAENWLKAQSSDVATRTILLSRLESQIYPTLGGMGIGKIKPATIRNWLGGLEDKKLSENYKLALFTVTSGVLDSAVDDRLIRDNPCKAKTVRRPTGGSPDVIVWPEIRVRAIRAGLVDRFGLVVPLGAGLGLRQGEILGLSPDDIDRAAMVVHVRRQVRIVQRQLMFSLPKGNKTRDVPLSAALLAEIEAYEDDYPAMAVTLPWRTLDGEPTTVPLLMTGDGGRVYSGDLFHKTIWNGAFRAAKIAYRKRADGMHALRHFYASVLLAQGVSVKELADYLGHSDPGFTLRTYTHLLPSSHDRARKAIDAVFSRPADADGLAAA